MSTTYRLKPAFQRLLRPIVRALAHAGVTANQMTITAVLLSLATGLALFLHPARHFLLLLPAVLFLRMALNAMDGMLAREHQQKSDLGAILNELGDVLSDAALYLPLATVPGFSPPLIVGVVILSILTEITGVLAIQVGATRRYDGPCGKSDRAFVLGLVALLLGLRAPIKPAINPILYVLTVLLSFTILNRIRSALHQVHPA